MATLFVASGGSNTSPYDTWAKAATSIQTALTAAASGDVVVVQYDAVPTSDAEGTGGLTLTLHSGWLICASNDGGSDYTPTAMGTSYWIGKSTASRAITLSAGTGAFCYVYGLTIRSAGSSPSAAMAAFTSSVGIHATLDSCRFMQSNTGASSADVSLGAGASVLDLKNCTITFSNASQKISCQGAVRMRDCAIAPTGTVPTSVFSANSTRATIELMGCDLSSVTNNIFAAPSSSVSYRGLLDRCKLGSGSSVIASGGSANLDSAEVWVLDSHTGDTHMEFGFYTGLGSLTKDTGVYYTTTGASWKVVTGSAVGPRNPFITPWIDQYNDTLSSITPYFEVLRDGSSTAWKDSELWAEFSAKTTSGYAIATSYSDVSTLVNRAANSGSNQATGAGAGSWTGEGGTIWSGKCDSGSSLTPAEVGYLRGRIAFGVASATLYIDPVIRT